MTFDPFPKFLSLPKFRNSQINQNRRISPQFFEELAEEEKAAPAEPPPPPEKEGPPPTQVNQLN